MMPDAYELAVVAGRSCNLSKALSRTNLIPATSPVERSKHASGVKAIEP